MPCNTAAIWIAARADRFVGMYVNDWTLDFGPRGREAVRQLLARGHAAGVIPKADRARVCRRRLGGRSNSSAPLSHHLLLPLGSSHLCLPRLPAYNEAVEHNIPSPSACPIRPEDFAPAWPERPESQPSHGLFMVIVMAGGLGMMLLAARSFWPRRWPPVVMAAVGFVFFFAAMAAFTTSSGAGGSATQSAKTSPRKKKRRGKGRLKAEGRRPRKMRCNFLLFFSYSLRSTVYSLFPHVSKIIRLVSRPAI